ncbi:actin filament-associated protein 1-like 2 isoform X3 [Oryzias melastigma]|uniref:actin filament-associated protein 1-like 2 isoform X3 n=1 Tax=Oryzias melastigma TaxID=30732 RepID=UPI00168D869F|nr:actin filament-associated protein 1-like 2 isoform X3 [Oryzias melastigma]
MFVPSPVLAKLMWDLQSFLSALDSENLSYIAQAQKKSLSELLSRLQPHESPVEDAEYMIMSCPSSSASNDPPDTPGTGVSSSELLPLQDSSLWRKSSNPSVPPHPPGGLGGDDEDMYEEAEPYMAASTTLPSTEKAESDSSHYESYGEEEDDEDELVKDRAHYIQWSSSQPCLRPAPESRICAYLWRRKWLGQWAKQLFIVRNDVLLCYKCARDLLPQLELNLLGSQVFYKCKTHSKIQHQLKVAPVGSDSLVLGYSSFQQAEEWRMVIQEVSLGSQKTQSVSSLMESDQLLSCRSSTATADSEDQKLPECWRTEEGTEERSCCGTLNLRTVWSKAVGYTGFLNVLMNCQWQNLRCRVQDGVLNMFGEEDHGDQEEVKGSPQYTVQLRGCEVRGGPDTDHAYRITLSMLGDQLAVLEVSSSEEKQQWFRLLKDASYHDDKAQEHSEDSLSGLQTRKFPASNTYMDDPFGVGGTCQDQHLYSNTSMLELMLHGSQDSNQRTSMSSKDSVTYSNAAFRSHNGRSPEVQRGVQKLELAGKTTVPLRAGSETHLPSAGRHSKRSSFRQSLALYTERAQVGILNPLLRRTASAKNSLRRAPSALFIEHGKVFQRKKEWETKAAA